MKLVLEKPYRVIWTEWEPVAKRHVSFIHYKKFVSEKEAEVQMLEMSKMSTWSNCTLGVIKETGIVVEGLEREGGS